MAKVLVKVCEAVGRRWAMRGTAGWVAAGAVSLLRAIVRRIRGRRRAEHTRRDLARHQLLEEELTRVRNVDLTDRTNHEEQHAISKTGPHHDTDAATLRPPHAALHLSVRRTWLIWVVLLHPRHWKTFFFRLAMAINPQMSHRWMRYLSDTLNSFSRRN